MKNKWVSFFIWSLISILGAVAFGLLALSQGESVNAIWILTAAVCTYAVAYRFYSRFIARRVFELDDQRKTPAEIHNDGKDFVPTNKWVLFGHHFAAIAGAGPLVGPILAAQMGYLPGTIWIIIGVVLGGAVQDFIILFGSMRRNGKSLGQIVREEIGPFGGFIALFAILGIMIILLAVLALVVVQALAHSPWGMFTLAMTLPIALLMGIYMRFLRPGRVLEASIIGFAMLLLSLWMGQAVAQDPSLAAIFTLEPTTISLLLIGYGFIASVIPVWLLLAPRDYLSTFLKIGVIFGLAISILIVMPKLSMPALTPFIHGNGPVFSGNMFPFVFITIACGSISGFHALVSSGTTPKMIRRESEARFIGFGGMLTESFVAIMALIAACILTPGAYFAINSPAAVVGTDVSQVATTVSTWGFSVTPDQLTGLAKDVGEETILSRTGGAPTLAIGMAHIFSQIIGGKSLMAFWYHFAILFEAVFILTTIDAGTRVGRFMLQDLLGHVSKKWGKTDWLPSNLVTSGIIVAGWGYFLYQGVVDPLGGIHTLWPLFGIANQMLAVIALIAGTTILIKMGKARYAWITLLPTAWLTTITMTAGWQKLFSPDPKIGFLAAADKFNAAIDANNVLPPAQSIAELKRIVFNNQLDAALTAIFMLLVIAILLDAARVWYKKLVRKETLPLAESPYIPWKKGGISG
ncbi:carbon starvation CstA family protein [Marininema halotolerans]|uniref:Carbon starvation protein n=1 Tax=Marininema halotolerans TaxID=1155944 RepID=A0A1I6NRR7_9BACL|nr:carbon starvation CstA family protein [Marininema halotolerans]SFS30551.1 carbon starvation protein [Marininema halotolerans]